MSLNLHATVRGAIRSVNADILATYLKSIGSTPTTGGQLTPNYASGVTVKIQAQPPSGKDLRHMEFLNIQGTTRTVFLYSDPQAIVRVNPQGGDLLQFPQFAGMPIDDWLVAAVPETWDVAQNGLVTFSGLGTLTVSSPTLDITTVNTGALELGDVIGSSAGLPLTPLAAIEAFGSGSGGLGTYTLSEDATATESTPLPIVVIDSAGRAGWSKLYCVLQTDRPA